MIPNSLLLTDIDNEKVIIDQIDFLSILNILYQKSEVVHLNFFIKNYTELFYLKLMEQRITYLLVLNIFKVGTGKRYLSKTSRVLYKFNMNFLNEVIGCDEVEKFRKEKSITVQGFHSQLLSTSLDECKSMCLFRQKV